MIWTVGQDAAKEPMYIQIVHIHVNTVDSRYLELGYLELCETRSVYLNQKHILIAFFNHNLVLETFLQVQITRSAKELSQQLRDIES